MVAATGAASVGGIAAAVGAKICAPQLRQKASPGAAGVPHFGHIVAFNVGSLIEPPEDVRTARTRWVDASIGKRNQCQ